MYVVKLKSLVLNLWFVVYQLDRGKCGLETGRSDNQTLFNFTSAGMAVHSLFDEKFGERVAVSMSKHHCIGLQGSSKNRQRHEKDRGRTK